MATSEPLLGPTPGRRSRTEGLLGSNAQASEARVEVPPANLALFGGSPTALSAGSVAATGTSVPKLQLGSSVDGGGAAQQGASTSVARRTVQSKEQLLVGDLLAAIDHSARTGLRDLSSAPNDRENVGRLAQQLAARIAHLVVVAKELDGASSNLARYKRDAETAFGRAQQFARALENVGGKPQQIHDALERVAEAVPSSAGWSWSRKPTSTRKVGDGLLHKEGVRIGTSTLSMVATRARRAENAKEPAIVKSTADACREWLKHAERELALAIDARPDSRDGIVGAVIDTGDALAALEGTAFRLGVGEDAAINAMRDAETALRIAVNLPAPRPFWDSAVPTLNAVVDVITKAHEVDPTKGVARPKWHPSHHPQVPPRYRRLLEDWFSITHGVVKQTGSLDAPLRGSALSARIDRAVADTMVLVNLVQKEADPSSLELVDDLFAQISVLRHRATSEIVDDVVEARAKEPLANGESPIAQLDEERQLKLTAMRLITVARALTSSAQRLAAVGGNEATIALETFKAQLKDAAIPAAMQQQLASATSIARVASYVANVANGINAVLNIEDDEQRKRLFKTEFQNYGVIGGGSELLKTLGGLVQGGVAAYGIAGYSWLRVRGFNVDARNLYSGVSNTFRGLNAAVNFLNLVHGAVMLAEGKTAGEKVRGAVEAAWGTLGLIALRTERLSRFTGPLSAALMLSWTTIDWLGQKTMQSLYAMIHMALTSAYEDMRVHAREVHSEATRLAVMLETARTLEAHEQIEELRRRITAFTHMLASSIRSYVDRTQRPGRDRDPGTWGAFRTRFKPLVGAKLDTELDVLISAEHFLEIVVACFESAEQVLEASVQQSLEEHGERNKRRL